MAGLRPTEKAPGGRRPRGGRTVPAEQGGPKEGSASSSPSTPTPSAAPDGLVGGGRAAPAPRSKAFAP
eukprot:5971159-Alexandrium_andersonii.AAC.1